MLYQMKKCIHHVYVCCLCNASKSEAKLFQEMILCTSLLDILWLTDFKMALILSVMTFVPFLMQLSFWVDDFVKLL